VPLDKSEGVVKAQLFGAVLRAPRGCQRWWRTKTLRISRWIISRWNQSFHQPSIRP